VTRSAGHSLAAALTEPSTFRNQSAGKIVGRGRADKTVPGGISTHHAATIDSTGLRGSGNLFINTIRTKLADVLTARG
jgi:hypothetical protein